MTHGPWIDLPENRAARLAAERVRLCLTDAGVGVSKRRESNPLFLHGPAGCGKTFLVNDLITRLIASNPEATVSLLPARELGSRDPDDLAPTQQADLLVIEDLQHLPRSGGDGVPKAAALTELSGLLDHRRCRERQIICTAIAGPAQLADVFGPLAHRLGSRLAQGLVVGLSAPNPESRAVFLRQRAKARGLDLADSAVARLIAALDGSLRQLDGALQRLELFRAAVPLGAGKTITAEHVEELFRDDNQARQLTVERIAARVGRYFRVEPNVLCSRSRSRQAMVPRQIGMYLARQLTDLSLERIGDYFGGRDHSTVLHACRKIEQALVSDPRLGGDVRALTADLG